MAALTIRSAVGRPLTNAEVDANFNALNQELGGKLVAASNLADIANTQEARSHLDVPSNTEAVNAAIAMAIALG